MVKSLLNLIKKDLEKSYELNNVAGMDIFTLHFGVCSYIRNRYLWNNKFIVELLNQHFKTKNVDDLSYEILKEILNNSQSTKPKI